MSAASFAVMLAGRGALPFTTLHGLPLYEHALGALAGHRPTVVVDAGHGQLSAIDRDDLDPDTPLLTVADWWAERLHSHGSAGPVLLHDPLCPLTPADFLVALAERAEREPETTLVGVRPVTDTLKAVRGDQIEGTIDRDRIATVTSPVVLGAALLGDPLPPPVEDFTALVAWARERGPVELVRAPSLARRVCDESSIHLLEAAVEMSRQLRSPVSAETARGTRPGT